MIMINVDIQFPHQGKNIDSVRFKNSVTEGRSEVINEKFLIICALRQILSQLSNQGGSTERGTEWWQMHANCGPKTRRVGTGLEL
jgi:hypothetical protein